MIFNYEVSYDDIQNFSKEFFVDKNQKKAFLKMYLKRQINLMITGIIVFFILSAVILRLIGFNGIIFYYYAILFLYLTILTIIILVLDSLLVLTPKQMSHFFSYNPITNEFRKKNQTITYLFETNGNSFFSHISIKNDKYIFSCPYSSVIGIYETDNFYAFVVNSSKQPCTFIIPKKYIQTSISSEFNEIISKIKNNVCKCKKAETIHYDYSLTKKSLGISMYNAVIIFDVISDNAKKLGLEIGDIILEINDKNIISNNYTNQGCLKEINKSKHNKHIKIKVKNIITNEIKTIETDL